MGLMGIHEYPGNLENPINKVGYLHSMYTEPEFRRRGICSRILEAFKEDASHLGIVRIDLHATEQGLPVYLSHGYKELPSKSLQLAL